MARLLGIACKEYRRGPMQELQQGELSPQLGLHGDYRGRPSQRQVTLLSLADWHTACTELQIQLPWMTRRANLLVDDLPLFESAGQRIVIGAAVLEITGETDPCSRMEEAQAGLFAALQPQWRGGVTCRVVQGGTIAIGDTVELIAGQVT